MTLLSAALSTEFEEPFTLTTYEQVGQSLVIYSTKNHELCGHEVPYYTGAHCNESIIMIRLCQNIGDIVPDEIYLVLAFNK